MNLDDYREQFAEASPQLKEVLESSLQDAARIMSPAGLQEYLEGGSGLYKLGRGTDLVASYLQEMPQVVKECGEDVIGDCIHAAMKLSSMTSGEVISLMFSSACCRQASRRSGIAARLSDADSSNLGQSIARSAADACQY